MKAVCESTEERPPQRPPSPPLALPLPMNPKAPLAKEGAIGEDGFRECDRDRECRRRQMQKAPRVISRARTPATTPPTIAPLLMVDSEEPPIGTTVGEELDDVSLLDVASSDDVDGVEGVDEEPGLELEGDEGIFKQDVSVPC